MTERLTLYADEGMILTDGEHFGKIVYLEIGADASSWHEITQEEYERIFEEMAKEHQPE
jgi:hypothetical protein